VLVAGIVSMLLIAAIELVIDMTNRRIDGIIELLQEDGMLANPPTVCRETPSEENPQRSVRTEIIP